MSLTGRIIEFLADDALHMGFVRKEEHNRVLAVDPRGRDLTVPQARIAVIHSQVPESDFPAAGRQLLQRIEARQAEIDLELLWQSFAGQPREIPPGELAAAYFGEASPETTSALIRALLEDGFYFRRKGSGFAPRTGEQVAAERLRQTREHERARFREDIAAWLTAAHQDKSLPLTEDRRGVIDRIQGWLVQRTGDEIGEILESVAGPEARELACDILVRSGRVGPSADRFLVMAGVEDRFSGSLLRSAEQIEPYVPQGDREAWPDAAFAIDDEDTREVDDALTVRRDGSDIVVGVHIADVSAFVDTGSELDAEARRRCSTIYLPTTTVTMFPEHLSTGLASLNAGALRPAFSIEVRFDSAGNRVEFRAALTSIQVERRLTYDTVDELIDEGMEPFATLQTLATHLQEQRASRGAVTFRRPELKIRVRDGHITVKKLNPKARSRLLVSEMMILANGLAADFAAARGLPVLYRCQERPREVPLPDTIHRIEALEFERLRRTFKRSRLSLTPSPHAGLGLSAYTQLSSPIRRYADLVTQRQFSTALQGKAPSYSKDELIQILGEAESAEVLIRGIEDKSNACWLLEYLSREKMGQALPAVVLDRTGNVELSDFFLRGKVSTTRDLTPGETIDVEIESVHPVRNTIRFRMK